MIAQKKHRLDIRTYRIPIIVVVLIILVVFIVVYKKDTVPLSSLTLSNLTDTTSLLPESTELLLSKKTRPDFQLLINTILQEHSFELAVARDDTKATSSVPAIALNTLAKIDDAIGALPVDDKKTFCSRLPTYSELLTKRIGDTRINIVNAFEKQTETMSAEYTSREKKVERNRNLRDEQVDTYFTRLRKLTATSTTNNYLGSLQTETIEMLAGSRKNTDQIINTTRLETAGMVEQYRDTVVSHIHTFNTLVSDKLSTAKKECAGGVSPHVARLNLHASLVVMQKNLSEIFQMIQNPQSEIAVLLKNKNESVEMAGLSRLNLLTKLEQIIETIPKK